MLSWFKRKPFKQEAAAMYRSLAGQSRRPEFYGQGGVPDSVDGRFDMAVLHAFLLMHRLAGEAQGAALNQALFDAMFSHFDLALREMGVQDLGVGRRIKQMADAFNGRTAAYRAAFDSGDRSALRAALVRNVYGKTAPTASQAEALTRYALDAHSRLAGQGATAIMRGEIDFPPFAVGG